ncbi:UDP-glucuronosyltransferase 2C1-like [Ctenocephalides felis]|uniref:UDP-glucuronosyltransferase 2C1-like n=1 Tax=Ctenocephalides felis TaxID=7515 RepID=UPI000E6E4B6C|nr:UDP-glucuronosyltransferase 2C1-like [Ctenocephalides felis]XP_026467805.1 UDP-glucuronosyltransferase 2C1-like [Ctenocephalides felis]
MRTVLLNLSLLLLIINGQNAEKPKRQKNILCIMAMASPSHHIWNKAIMQTLASNGHNVTALSIDTDETSGPNIHYLKINGVYESLYSGDEPFDLLEFSKKSLIGITVDTAKWFLTVCRASLRSEGVQRLLEYPKDFKFDLVIFDYTNLPCLHGFVSRFNSPPQIGITAFANPPHTSDLVGSPNFVSLKPHYTTTMGSTMSFLERLYNSLLYSVELVQRRMLIWWVRNEVREVFGDDELDVGALEKEVELVMVNSHPGMDVPEPVLPNVIQVGGLQIKEPKALPEDLKRFLESSKKGSVLFSLGTNMKSEIIGEEKISMFINAISRFPEYNFLWKIELENRTFPKNLMVRKWLPQNNVLAHPNIKLFITHGGLLSSQESTWHGVPIIGMPFFVDQHTNVQKSVDAGVGEKLDFFQLTEEIVYQKIKMILENTSYRQKMALRSSRFRDRPMHPLQEATWWCEYVLRHNGAPHLKSLAAVMEAPALFMWDLMLVWLGIFLGVAFLVVFGLRKIFRRKEVTNIRRKEFEEKKIR